MPELPEVETFVRRLRKPLVGRRITAVKVTWRNMLGGKSIAAFTKAVTGGRIRSIDRRAKYLVFELSSPQKFLIMHLRMSGVLEIHPATEPRSPYDRVIFSLDNGNELRFNDTRKFGKLHVTENREEILGKLGPEPLDPKLKFEHFSALFTSRSGALKPLLLNQSFLAGLGNIYVDEVLWRSKLHPRRKAESLKRTDHELLFDSIKVILKRAIVSQGTDFGDGVVPGGGYSPRVYGRDGRPCFRCKTPISRSVVGQRGTHFCPSCQPRSPQRTLSK